MINRFVDPALMYMFVYIAEEGSFTGAAERMHLTQQAVSAQMKRLEELLGRTLVRRSGSRVELTHDGEVLLLSAQKVVAISDRIRRQFSVVPLEGLVRFGLTPGTGHSLLFPILSELRKNNPKLEIRCKTANSTKLIAKLEAGALDVILGAQPAGGVRGEVLRREKLIWVGDVKNLIKPDSVVPLVMLPSPTFVRDQVFRALSEAGLKWVIHSECEDPLTMRAAILAGWGISVFNEDLIASDPSFPHETNPEILPDPGSIEFFMRYENINQDKCVDTFVSILRTTLGKH